MLRASSIRRRRESSDHFAGLDVSVKETSVCIVDDTGRIVREVKVASEPEALLAVLKNTAYHFKRIGLEAGPLSQWLFSALAEAGLPAICVETRHMRAVLKAQINKTDRNDARGMAQMMRAGLYRPVHVKTLRSQKHRMLLTHRKLLQSKAIAIDNDLRGTLRNFGLKVGIVGTLKFETRIKKVVENLPDLVVLVEPLLVVRRVLREQIGVLHRRLLAIVRDDDVCRRLMTIPGVGPVVALTYRATVDVPARFRNSKAVGAVFGLTPSKYQSGEINRTVRYVKVRGPNDAGDALRSGPGHADPHQQVVLAQGRGVCKDRQAPRDEEGDRGLGTPPRRDHAPHMGRRHRVPVDPGSRRGMRAVRESIAIGEHSSSTERWNDVPRGTMDEVSSFGRLDLPFV